MAVNNQSKYITLLDLGERKQGQNSRNLRLRLPRIMEESVRDFGFSMQMKSKPILLNVSETGYVILMKLNSITGKLLSYRTNKITLMKARRERVSNISLSADSEHLAISIKDSRYLIGSRILIFRQKCLNLVLVNTIDFHFESLSQFSALNFYDKYRDFLVLCGLTAGEKTHVRTYTLNLKTGSFNEVYELRMDIENLESPIKLIKVQGGALYSSDLNGFILQIRYFE